MINDFNFARPPKILFGNGKISQVPGLISMAGEKALIITGGSSYRTAGYWDNFADELNRNNVEWRHITVSGEPSPDLVDSVVAEYTGQGIEVVAAIGGGSVVDAGKAISAMLRHRGSVKDYLEGIGDPSKLTGDKIPFIAVSTTAGTGSEATKNAVLSRVGPGGFKKSLRHDNFVPDAAVLDPELMISCPPGVTAACGMDAFSQLLESYASTNASPVTDALALSGLKYISDCLVPACGDGAADPGVRAGMAYASLMSGITLANAGLCTVHGIAATLGGLFDIPHGTICGTMLAPCMEITINKLLDEHGPEHFSIRKFAVAGNVLCKTDEPDAARACGLLAGKLNELTELLEIPRLGEFGIKESDLEVIAGASGNKYNPVELSSTEIRETLVMRL